MNGDRLKFRIWDEYYNKYLNARSDIAITQDGRLMIETLDGLDEIDPSGETFVVEQCTGIKDATGNLIYEGDIISGRNPDVKHVVKHEEDLALFLAHLLPLNEFGTLTSNISQAWIDEFSKRIVGNIHENPELLEEQK